MKKEVKVEDRRWRLKLYKNCFVGEEAVEWIKRNVEGVTTEAQAVKVGTLLQKFGLVSHVVHDQDFQNGYFFYHFLPRIIHSGYLFYRSALSKPFERYWFVLREDCLISHSQVEEEKPSFRIPLVNFAVSSFLVESESPHLLHFSIVSPTNVYYFAATTELQREDWIFCLAPLNPSLNAENSFFQQIEAQVTAETWFKRTK